MILYTFHDLPFALFIGITFIYISNFANTL